MRATPCYCLTWDNLGQSGMGEMTAPTVMERASVRRSRMWLKYSIIQRAGGSGADYAW
ncbi:MAG TPA: hypothetical protein VID72_10690 [Ktedonobacterales bacterium]